MPRRQSSAMLYSFLSPSSMMRFFSSAEWCFRVAQRISFTICLGVVARVSDFAVADLRLCLICASSKSYDEPEVHSSSSHSDYLKSADAGHLAMGLSADDAITANKFKGLFDDVGVHAVFPAPVELYKAVRI